MIPRDRALTTLRCQVPDKVPRLMAFTPPVLEDFHRWTGATHPAHYFDFEVRHVGIGPTKQEVDFSPYLGPLPSNAWVNEWGIGHVPGSECHFEDHTHPLRNVSSPGELDDYPFPDVLADYRWEGTAARVAR